VAFGDERPRERDFERFLTFVDAVVAIAITLLVLPLVDLAGSLRPGESVADLIGDNSAKLGSALLSFAVIARLWLAQHHVVRNVVRQDRIVTRLMLLWLLMIALLPFPTALLADGGSQALTKLLYVGTMAISSFCLAGMARHISRTPAIRDSDDAPDAIGAMTAGVTLLLALAISLAIPATSYWPLLLLLVTDRVADLRRSGVSKWARERRRADEAA
jgi:uncharacterized membrane protein